MWVYTVHEDKLWNKTSRVQLLALLGFSFGPWALYPDNLLYKIGTIMKQSG